MYVLGWAHTDVSCFTAVLIQNKLQCEVWCINQASKVLHATATYMCYVDAHQF